MLGASEGPGIRRLTLWVIVTAKAPAGGRLLYPASAPVTLPLPLLQATADVSPGPVRGRRAGGHLPGPHMPRSGGSPRPIEPEAATQPGGSGGRERRELRSPAGPLRPRRPEVRAHPLQESRGRAGLPGNWARGSPAHAGAAWPPPPPPHPRLLPSKGLASTSLLAPPETQKPESWGATNNCSPSRGVSGE